MTFRFSSAAASRAAGWGDQNEAARRRRLAGKLNSIPLLPPVIR